MGKLFAVDELLHEFEVEVGAVCITLLVEADVGFAAQPLLRLLTTDFVVGATTSGFCLGVDLIVLSNPLAGDQIWGGFMRGCVAVKG